MDKEYTERMQKALLALKEEILNNLMSENAAFREIVENLDPKDLADIAADDTDRSTIEAIGAQELKSLRLIDAALGRISANRYGVCMKCGSQIPRERLEAIPYALLCIDCKSSEERRNR